MISTVEAKFFLQEFDWLSLSLSLNLFAIFTILIIIFSILLC